MLVNYDPSRPLHILGTGISADKLKSYVGRDTDGEIILVDHNDFDSITSKHQCIPGFFNYRDRFVEFLKTKNPQWVSYISERAYVDPTATIGLGTVVMPMAMVDYQTTIGSQCMVAPFAMIGHGSSIGNNTVLCPKSTICGGAIVGNNCYVGPTATLAHHVKITNDSTFVIASVVTKDIDTPGRYYGNKRIL